MSTLGPPSVGTSSTPLSRRQSTSSRRLSVTKTKANVNAAMGGRKPSSNFQQAGSGERSVKQLRLSKALTIPDSTTVLDACRRMATRRVNAALVTDSSALLCGIITDKDVAARVIAEGLQPERIPVSKVMTRNPTFVMVDTSAVDALQKMVQGKFRHLPVVENGEVVALLDITKCLYDAIARLEKAVEKGDAIAAVVEGVEREWGTSVAALPNFVETLREKLFRPSLGSIIADDARVATVSPSDSVSTATKKMQELGVNSVIVTTNNKPDGILTSKDVLMKVVSRNLLPDVTSVEKVMTPKPECGTVDTIIVDALHTMHDGKFLHLPVLDREGFVVGCVDVLQITHAALATVGSTAGGSDIASMMMHKFWDSVFALEPPEDNEDSHSDFSAAPILGDTFEFDPVKPVQSGGGLVNTFSFKLLDCHGRIHRFTCGTESLAELISAISQRIGLDVGQAQLPHVLYEDDEGDHVLLITDEDLHAAVIHARSMEWKVLKLHLDYGSLELKEENEELGEDLRVSITGKKRQHSAVTYTAIGVASVAVLATCMLLYMRHSRTHTS